MNKIVVVVPYFGSLPSNFSFFLKSCSKNENIDFIIFTDSEIQSSVKNIKIEKMTFEQFRMLIQKAFDFLITLETPYKLCDYKPTYGKVLQDWFKHYDFWGYCDVDLLFGRIDHFVTDELVGKYDQIYQHGHFTLYRNSEVNNQRFLEAIGVSYKEVFTSNRIYFFDEQIMPKKMDSLGVTKYVGKDFIDIDPWHYRLVDVYESDYQLLKQQFTLFEWDNGKLYKWTFHKNTGNINKTEYLYIHFQKRSMVDHTNDENQVLITNRGLLPRNTKLEKKLFLEHDQNNFLLDIKKKLDKQKFILNRRIKRYILK